MRMSRRAGIIGSAPSITVPELFADAVVQASAAYNRDSKSYLSIALSSMSSNYPSYVFALTNNGFTTDRGYQLAKITKSDSVFGKAIIYMAA